MWILKQEFLRLYFKDAVRALWLLSRAKREKIKTMVYIIAGLTPPYSAKELAEVVRSRIPGARLTFKPDPTLMELVKEIGTLRFNEERARVRMGMEDLLFPTRNGR